MGMNKREKVIKGLECCRWGRQNVKPEKFKCDECPYKDETIMNAFSVFQSCTNVLAREALDLLKKQEAEIEHMKRPDCEHAEHDGIGCLGYCGCTQDDEPIESCKRCEKYTGNVYEAVSGNEL